MGMTIDECYKWVRNAKIIMRKYEKIEQILDDCDLEAWEILEKVKEVVKNGNVD